MSCATNKTTAATNFTNAAFSSSVSTIRVREETAVTNEQVTLQVVRGKLELDLTDYDNGTAVLYVKVAPQTNGSSNGPPVVADSLFHSLLNATVAQVNTSGYYGDITPSFTISGCPNEVKGWTITDQIGVVAPVWTYNV